MTHSTDEPTSDAKEVADAIEFGYTLGANARAELARWLRARGDIDPYAQRIVRMVRLQHEVR